MGRSTSSSSGPRSDDERMAVSNSNMRTIVEGMRDPMEVIEEETSMTEPPELKRARIMQVLTDEVKQEQQHEVEEELQEQEQSMDGFTAQDVRAGDMKDVRAGDMKELQ